MHQLLGKNEFYLGKLGPAEEESRKLADIFHQHPLTATSWRENDIVALGDMNGVVETKWRMCWLDMTQEVGEQHKLALKSTGCHTSSPEIASNLNWICRGERDHVIM